MNARRVIILIALLSVLHNALRVLALLLGNRWGLFNYLSVVREKPLDAAVLMEILGLVAVVVLAVLVAGSLWRKSSEPAPLWSSALWAAGAGAGTGLITVYSSAAAHNYGWILFVAAPVLVGFISVLALASHKRVNLRDALIVSMSSVILLGGILVAFAIEGAICLVMALPIAIPLAMLGAAIGYASQSRLAEHSPMMFLVLLGVMPFGASLERSVQPPAETFAVTTTLDIPAPPQRVWQTVLRPAKLRPPSQLLFRAGVAYPLASHIEGSGPAAIRYCDFSTGKLVEPVLIWDDLHQLRFAVASNPLPMQEWTPYAQIHPPHLDGFLVSRQGEFQLEPLPDGGTRLRATTWYQHHLWPERYWRWWSDYIIHRVHNLVLENIRDRSSLRETAPLFR